MFKRFVSEFILAKGHFRLTPSLSFKARLSWYENDFFFHANKTHFYKKGFALSRVSKVRDLMELENGLYHMLITFHN